MCISLQSCSFKLLFKASKALQTKSQAASYLAEALLKQKGRSKQKQFRRESYLPVKVCLYDIDYKETDLDVSS